LQIMEAVAPESKEVFRSRLLLMGKRFETRVSREYNEIEEDYLSLPQVKEAPLFHHPEISHLYEFSLRIDSAIMQEILALPRETLIKDLQEVIYDSIRRFKVLADEDWVEENGCFLLHSMTLLAELKAVEALPALLEILKQGNDYLKFWFGDILTEDLWQIYFQVFDADVCDEYLRQPRHYTFAKSLIAEVFIRKISAGDVSRAYALDFYIALLKFFIAHQDDDDLISDTFMGGLMGDICDLKLTELLPAMKVCYDLGLVDEWVCGDYAAVEKDIYSSHERTERENLLASGYQKFYDNLMSWMHYYKRDKVHTLNSNIYHAEDTKVPEALTTQTDYFRRPAYIEDTKTPEVLTAIRKSTTGRNDPCPCGSGRKYKKCCMN
jgi:hypothetical protein